MTVVVADDSDRAQLRRVREQLLGLPDRLLTEGPAGNASLSWNRRRALPRPQPRGGAARGWDERRYRRLVYRGLLAGLASAEPAREESAIPPLPAWATDRVAELSEERVRELVDSGVRVVGDATRLLAPAPVDVAAELEAPASVSIEAAVRGLEALVDALRRERSRTTPRTGRLR